MIDDKEPSTESSPKSVIQKAFAFAKKAEQQALTFMKNGTLSGAFPHISGIIQNIKLKLKTVKINEISSLIGTTVVQSFNRVRSSLQYAGIGEQTSTLAKKLKHAIQSDDTFKLSPKTVRTLERIQFLILRYSCFALAPPPRCLRVERMIEKYALSYADLVRLHRAFTKFDYNQSGMMSMDSYFRDLLKVPRNILASGLPPIIDVRSETFLSFGEYVELTCTFVYYEADDIIRYCFTLLDKDRVGFVLKDELIYFVKDMWCGEVSSNLEMAIKNFSQFDNVREGQYFYNDIRAIHRNYPMVFFPAFQLQFSMMTSSLGDLVWDWKKKSLQVRLDDRQARLLKAQKRAEKLELAAKNRNEERIVMDRLGYLYYIMPWLRENERQKIRRIHATYKDIAQ